MALVEYTEEEPSVAEGGSKLVPYKEEATQPPARSRTFREELGHQLKRTGRMALTGATGVGGAIADFGYGATNLAGLLTTGKPLIQTAPPSQEFQRKLTQLGLPEDVTPEEKVTGFVGSMVGGVADPANKAMQASLALRNVPANFKSEVDTVKETAQMLRKQGVKLPPSIAGGSPVTTTLEGIGGSGRIAQNMKASNQEVFQDLARKANNIPKSSPVSRDVLERQAAALAEEGYEPIKQLPKIGIGRVMRNELNQIKTDLADNRSFPLASKDVVRQEVNKYLYTDDLRYVTSYSGKDAIKSIQTLRQEASDLFRSDLPDAKILAATKKRIAKILEDQIERHLGPNNKLLDKFKDTRVQLAKNYATRDILSDPISGTVDPVKAASLHYSGEPLTGELEIIAKAGIPRLRKATGVPVAGESPAISPWDALMAVGGGSQATAATIAGSNPLVGASVALLPAVKGAIRKGLESPTTQRMMAARGLLDENTLNSMRMQAAIQAAPGIGLLNPWQEPPPLFGQGQQ